MKVWWSQPSEHPNIWHQKYSARNPHTKATKSIFLQQVWYSLSWWPLKCHLIRLTMTTGYTNYSKRTTCINSGSTTKENRGSMKVLWLTNSKIFAPSFSVSALKEDRLSQMFWVTFGCPTTKCSLKLTQPKHLPCTKKDSSKLKSLMQHN